MKFEQKVVFITGGARGLGKAMAKAFLDEGASVGVNSRRPEAVTAFEEEFKERPAKAFMADVSDFQAMETLADKVAEEFGKIDILINNAGIVNPLVPAEKIKKEDFDKLIDVNLKGAFYSTQIFGRKMIAQGSGRIISISSQVGLFGEKGFLPYAISKGALQVMTRNLAFEWSRSGVTLCCIAPGFIAGGMNEGLIRRQSFVDYLASRTPIGRMGKVEELVSTVLFLASQEAYYLNGETIVIDGGMTGYVQESLLDMIAKGK